MKKKGPGRPNQGKTKTIRERTINVYLPSVELVNEWKSAAKKSGVSVSQFVLEAVERQRSHGYGDSPLPKLELENQYKKALKKIEKIEEKLDFEKTAYATREQDILKLKEQLDQRKEGPCDIDLAVDMIEVFRTWPEPKIFGLDMLEVLGITDDDQKRVQQVREAANYLELLGFMKSSGFLTWRWLGKRSPQKDFTSKWTGKTYGKNTESPE
jgi:hypothetical protein